jgi:hypothetical protein
MVAPLVVAHGIALQQELTYIENVLECGNLQRFGSVTDPDPRIRTNGRRIRILIFSLVIFKMPTQKLSFVPSLFAFYLPKVHLHQTKITTF